MSYALSVEDIAQHFSEENAYFPALNFFVCLEINFIPRYDQDILTAQYIPRPPRSRYVIPPKYLPARSAKK